VIQKANKDETNIVNEQFAVALSESRNRDFLKEVENKRCSASNVSSFVDGQSSAANIADAFASKYSNFYTNVSFMMS